jgi:predicted  nucleic acid-binding Zn-ribbon protein
MCEDASEPPTVGGGPIETSERRTVAAMVDNVFTFDPDKSGVSISNWIPMIFTFKSTIDKSAVEKIFDKFVGKILQKCPECGINTEASAAKGDAATAAAAAAAAANAKAAADRTEKRTTNIRPPPPSATRAPIQRPKGGKLSDENCDCVRTDRVLSYSLPVKGDVYGVETDRGIVYNDELENGTIQAKNVFYIKTREYARGNNKNYNIYWSNNEKELEDYVNIVLRASLQKQMTQV